MIPLPALSDERIRLRAFRADDVPVVAHACADPLTQLYTRVPSPYGIEDAREFIDGAGVRRMMGEALDLAIADLDDDRVLGAIGLVIDRHDVHRAEIGYWVSPRERGGGIAGRAVMLLSRWALGAGGFARLDLQAALANGASIRTAERCGFVREATLRSAWFRGEGRSDMALFSLLPADLEPGRGG